MTYTPTHVHQIKSKSIHGEDSSEKCDLKQREVVHIFSILSKECTFKGECTFTKGSASHHQIQGSVYKDNSE